MVIRSASADLPTAASASVGRASLTLEYYANMDSWWNGYTVGFGRPTDSRFGVCRTRLSHAGILCKHGLVVEWLYGRLRPTYRQPLRRLSDAPLSRWNIMQTWTRGGMVNTPLSHRGDSRFDPARVQGLFLFFAAAKKRKPPLKEKQALLFEKKGLQGKRK